MFPMIWEGMHIVTWKLNGLSSGKPERLQQTLLSCSDADSWKTLPRCFHWTWWVFNWNNPQPFECLKEQMFLRESLCDVFGQTDQTDQVDDHWTFVNTHLPTIGQNVFGVLDAMQTITVFICFLWCLALKQASCHHNWLSWLLLVFVFSFFAEVISLFLAARQIWVRADGEKIPFD